MAWIDIGSRNRLRQIYSGKKFAYVSFTPGFQKDSDDIVRGGMGYTQRWMDEGETLRRKFFMARDTAPIVFAGR